MSLGFGSAARVGQLYPSGGLCDFEPQLMAPEGVQFLTTRMTFKRSGLEDDIAFVKDLEAHAGLLADAQVDLIAMNCTAASLVAGPVNINRRILAATGIRSITTIEAVMAAMRATGMTRIGLMTPYVEEVVTAEVDYLHSQGHTVVATAGQPCHTPIEQGSLPAETWLHHARSLRGQEMDGLLISCAGIQIAPVLAQIERELGVPVVTSNQALVWACLGLCGVEKTSPGYGRLLEGHYGRHVRDVGLAVA